MDPEDIVRSLAAKSPIEGEYHLCTLCDPNPDDGGPYIADDGSLIHEPDCPFRLAVEWVSEHPEGANP